MKPNKTVLLAVDGYFMKKSFIEPMLDLGLEVITRMRPDANLQDLYKGPQKTGRGRKWNYAGKVDMNNIDKRRWKLCYEDDHILGFELIVWCVTFKKRIQSGILEEQTGSRAYRFFRHRYEYGWKEDHTILWIKVPNRIFNLIRDAKQYNGLEEGQAVGENKLYSHFNLSIMSVSFMKFTCWASLKDKSGTPFSMRSIKTWYYNKYLTEAIFSNLGLELNCNKIRRLYFKCLNIVSMAA